jgi:hypothetical protein
MRRSRGSRDRRGAGRFFSLLLGGALFVVHAYFNRGVVAVESSKQIMLTLDDLRQLNLYFESQ